MKTLTAISAAALLWIGASPACADDESTLRVSLQKAINGYLASQRGSEHISAISLSVSLPSQAENINLATGQRSWNTGAPVATGDLWQIGSNTKAFTAVILLQLEAEGKLTIDQTVSTWLPQYPAWKNVSIRRLLNMTSGIPGYDNVPAMLRAENSIYRRWTPEQLIAFSDPIYPGAPKPTHGYDYSNTNYMLAGLIIERVTGHTYAEELIKRIFQPLALKSTFYSPNVYPKTVTDRMVSGYFDNTSPGNEGIQWMIGRDVRLMDMSWAGAAGGIVSTPQEVTRWAKALYTGDILAAKQRRELMSIVSIKAGKPIAVTSPADPAGFGLGVAQATRKPLGTYWYYQGETLGYRMVHAWFPKSGAIIAVGLNSQPTKNNVGQLMQSLWEALHKAGKV